MAAAGKDVSKRNAAEIAAARERVVAAKKNAPNPVWFKPVMFGFMLIGLVWIVMFYVTSATLVLPIPALGQANMLVGFGFMLIGFLMTPWWK